ncbi:Bug family tripartite tricarboxylate transporter substrate binding protein [Roseomonas populi]|uniref:Tripartite tricarboxylate transporter substrate binding protein n=1 Tax=Roseomonas populi TaxID=3121582 RepID=A0ABT1WZ06_9PROT|nr:tripartite tricarboxylate transporter substrate binding protein [Roseomonas pecuniae]MCR0981072.1 tripartite tricarboxylate transporter substrate binding protein [Roseomonas pecuniae]
MSQPTKIARRLFLAGAAAPLLARAARAQPGAPLRIVVPFTAGGLTDLLARRVADGMSRNLGVPVIVDNRPGAAGIPAILSLRGVPADGNTLYMTYLGPHAANASLYASLPYDPVKDFTPVGAVADSPLTLCVTPGMAARNLAELIAYAKANPGRLNFASVGNGSPSHLALELFKLQAGVNIVHVPYRGTAQVAPDLLTGVVDGYFDPAATATPNLQSGQIRAFGVASDKRLPQFPSVPTMAEAGLDFRFSTWFGLVAAGQVPAARRDELNAGLNRIVGAPDFAAWCEGLSLRPLPGSAEDFRRFMAEETDRLGRVVRSANIRLE